MSTRLRMRWGGALVATVIGLMSLAAPAHTTLSAPGPHLTPAVLHTSYHQVGAAVRPATATFSCQITTPNPACYSPQTLRQAYGVQPLLDRGITGSGRTIVIIDAFQSPTIAHDVQTFDLVFGLPDPTLNIITPDGLTPFDQSDAAQTNWAGQISVDVEWAHAIAPAATIDLVLAKSAQDADIFSAIKYAVDHNLGDVIALGFGEAERCADPTVLSNEHRVFQQAVAVKRITIVALSGDTGAAQLSCDGTTYILSASTPASDPDVTAVGGTHLSTDTTTGAYSGETAWNDSFGASGGGFSTIYRTPSYQARIPGIGRYRGIPDVAYDGAQLSGVLVVWSSSGQGSNLVFLYGGTSDGAAQWAGIAALADQQANARLGLLNTTLYLLGRTQLYSQFFHDITTGNNTVTLSGSKGYTAGPGWDPVTGWGTPNLAQLANLASLIHATERVPG